MDNFISIIEAWGSIYDCALRSLGYENEILDSLKKNEAEKPFAKKTIENQARKIHALMYICEKIRRLAYLEGVSGEGVKYLEDKNREDGDDNVPSIES